MSLNALISRYYVLEASLRSAMLRHTTVDERVDLLRRVADTLEAIERFTPTDEKERREQIYFFLVRAISRPGISVDGRDINLVLTLTSADGEGIGDAPETPKDPAAASPASPASDLIDYVTAAKERVSLVDSGLRYVATSQPNAEFYGTSQARLVGLQLSEVAARPEHVFRMRPYFDRALQGTPVEYYYELVLDEALHLMRCEMKPVTVDPIGPCVMIYTRDVTYEVAVRDGVPVERE